MLTGTRQGALPIRALELSGVKKQGECKNTVDLQSRGGERGPKTEERRRLLSSFIGHPRLSLCQPPSGWEGEEVVTMPLWFLSQPEPMAAGEPDSVKC